MQSPGVTARLLAHSSQSSACSTPGKKDEAVSLSIWLHEMQEERVQTDPALPRALWMDAHAGTAPSQGRSPDRVCTSTPQQRGWAELFIHTCSCVFLNHQLQGSSKARRHRWDQLLLSGTRRKSSDFCQIQHPTQGKVLTSGVCTPQTGWGCPGAFSSLLHLALG